MRLDQALVARGLIDSRSKALDLIKLGVVKVNQRLILKPAKIIKSNDEISVNKNTFNWVSRGAKKLLFAIEVFAVKPEDKIVFDLGASTGGFTEVVLEQGAKKVYAIDVGYNQLHKKLKADSRVRDLSPVDVRKINDLDLPNPEWLVADLSFISLVKALPVAMEMAKSGAYMVCLIKPQFELSKKEVGKNGVVKSDTLRKFAVSKVVDFFIEENWKVLGIEPSPILGRSGNKEFLLLAKKNSEQPTLSDPDVLNIDPTKHKLA